jgi:hypothetical protein
MSCLEKWTSRIAVIVTAGVVCWLMLHNWKSKEFFDASFTTCISIIIAVGISYLLSQRQTDKRKQKEILQSVLKALQDRINDPGAYSITESTPPESLTSRNREIQNYLSLLDGKKTQFGIDREVDFLKEKFLEYETCIGDHISSIPWLMEASKELRRPLDLMNTKIYDTMLKLYQ